MIPARGSFPHGSGAGYGGNGGASYLGAAAMVAEKSKSLRSETSTLTVSVLRMARTPPTRALAAGVVDAGSMSAGVIDATTVRVGFPVQNLLGNYSLQDAPTLTNFCLPLAQNFTGTFSITLPTISGTVSDTNAHLSPM